MNIRDKLYMEQLHRDRSDSADTFEKPSTRDMWRSIVEKYSDQAHFIYELIQNADDRTENIHRLQLVKKLEGLLKQSGDCAEYSSEDIEEILFGAPNYLEDNAFSTGHQNVNVYGKPEKRYEIRTEDNAVDVQLVDADRSERLGR